MRASVGTRWCLALLIAGGLTGTLSGCLYASIPDVPSTEWLDEYEYEYEYEPQDMLLVVFALDSEFGGPDVLDAMWPVEEQAMVALEEAGAGIVDGNEIGASEYGLYFYGPDHDVMWELLEPIMETAPIPLSRVELWPADETADPEIIEFDPQG